MIEETIQDLERGKLTMPQDADPAAFILSGGKLSGRPQIDSGTSQEARKPPTVEQVFHVYAETLTPGSKEANSLGTEAVHRRHFLRVIGGKLPFESLGVDAVQKYVDARAREGVGRETIR